MATDNPLSDDEKAFLDRVKELTSSRYSQFYTYVKNKGLAYAKQKYQLFDPEYLKKLARQEKSQKRKEETENIKLDNEILLPSKKYLERLLDQDIFTEKFRAFFTKYGIQQLSTDNLEAVRNVTKQSGNINGKIRNKNYYGDSRKITGDIQMLDMLLKSGYNFSKNYKMHPDEEFLHSEENYIRSTLETELDVSKQRIRCSIELTVYIQLGMNGHTTIISMKSYNSNYFLSDDSKIVEPPDFNSVKYTVEKTVNDFNSKLDLHFDKGYTTMDSIIEGILNKIRKYLKEGAEHFKLVKYLTNYPEIMKLLDVSNGDELKTASKLGEIGF